MREKILDILFIIGMFLIFLCGIWGIIYEFLILDKTIIPVHVMILSFVGGYVGVTFILFWYFYNKKHKS